ncbi:MAG: type II secretion system protein [Verrucomicrobiota bacterium]
MKQRMRRGREAFTRIELIVVIAIIAVLVSVFLPGLRQAKQDHHIFCISVLGEIGTAYRVWAGDNGDLMPFQQSVSKGGWKELLTNANQGAICWTNYAIMQNELGQSPKLVVCPNDERLPAQSFTNNFDNTHVSYFVGVGASDAYPQSILGGDRNLGLGTTPDREYGFSPKSGKGNDVAIPLSGPVSWSSKMHSAGKPAGAGNILLGDGSVQFLVSTAALNQDWLRNAAPTTNWPAGHVPATPSIRLVFP